MRATDSLVVGCAGAPVADVGAWVALLQEGAAGLGLRAQAADAAAVCGPEHAASALLHARRALERGTNLARSLEVEWVLCLAGRRQVSSAMGAAGLREGTDRFAMLLMAEGDLGDGQVEALLSRLDLTRDDGVLRCTREGLERLGVAQEELSAVPEGRWTDLALERTAMLDLER